MARARSAGAFGGDIGEQRFSELFDLYKRHLAWIGVAIIVLGAGTWFYVRSRTIKQQRAEAAYQTATQSVAAGNIPLAESDLKKLVARYAGTNGGTMGAMELAKLYYQQGKYTEGIAALKSAAADKGDLQFAASMLLAAGYEGAQQPAEAAKEYESAASVARFDADKSSARAAAARAYEAANDKAAAIRIWTDLLNDPAQTFDIEAKVRLGELEAKPIKV